MFRDINEFSNSKSVCKLYIFQSNSVYLVCALLVTWFTYCIQLLTKLWKLFEEYFCLAVFIPPANTTRGGILESADRWFGGQSFCKMLSQNPPKVVKASKWSLLHMTSMTCRAYFWWGWAKGFQRCGPFVYPCILVSWYKAWTGDILITISDTSSLFKFSSCVTLLLKCL